MCRITDVKIFAIRFIQAEYLQCAAGITGINRLHIGIFLENLVQLFAADVFDLTPQGDRDFVFGGGQCNVALLHKLGIECLAPCSKKIHALLVIEHHVDHSGLGMPVCSDGGNGGGVDIFHQ